MNLRENASDLTYFVSMQLQYEDYGVSVVAHSPTRVLLGFDAVIILYS